jgi:3-hydroxyisobutyrate dehydrogenase
MAGHLARGAAMTVYNRTQAKAEDWVAQHGHRSAPTPREAAEAAAVVLACVGNDDDLRSVCLGPDGAFAGMAAGALFVDHTTVSAQVTRELARAAAERGIGYVDAPVSGGQAGRRQRAAFDNVRCSADHYARAEAVVAPYSRICRRLGEVARGNMPRCATRSPLPGWCRGLSEALSFADKAGAGRAALVEVISQGAAGSWQMVNRTGR